jgi:atypical dual specificity phosphatase
LNPLFAKLLFPPTYAWNLLLGRVLKARNWWDEVEPGLMLGARPLRRDVETFAKLQVGSVVNMCEEYRGPVDLYEKYSIDQLWLPTTDFNAPSLEQVQQGVEYIQARLETDAPRGGKVYIHCKAGRARSATVVLCWMVKYGGMTPEAAQKRLIEVRPHVNRELCQRKVVQEFIKTL